MPFCCSAALLLCCSARARIGRGQAVFARPGRHFYRSAGAIRYEGGDTRPPCSADAHPPLSSIRCHEALSCTEQHRVESNTFAREACSSHDHFPHRELGTLLSTLPTSVALDSCSAAVGGRFECRANASRRMTKGLQPVLAHRSESAIPVLAGCINTSECVTLIYPCVLALLEPPRAFRCRRFFHDIVPRATSPLP